MNQTQLAAFGAYCDLLIERSLRVNLTAIKDERGIVIKHFVDSLCAAAYVPELADAVRAGGGSERVRLIDIGAGAGFPGIPLKILLGDELSVTMLDSVGKKINFMNEVTGLLGLADCEAIHIRAEDASRRDDLHRRFSFATARALAPLPKIIEYCLPFLQPGGLLIAMKGRRETTEAELESSGTLIKNSYCKILRVTSYKLETADYFDAGYGSADYYDRTLVIIKREK